MKLYNNFFSINGWFSGNVNSFGPIQMAYKKGDLGGKPLHYHLFAYEYFIIQKGYCSIDIEEETYLLEKGSIIVVEPREKHIIYKCSPDLETLILIDAYYENDTKIVRY